MGGQEHEEDITLKDKSNILFRGKRGTTTGNEEIWICSFFGGKIILYWKCEIGSVQDFQRLNKYTNILINDYFNQGKNESLRHKRDYKGRIFNNWSRKVQVRALWWRWVCEKISPDS